MAVVSKSLIEQMLRDEEYEINTPWSLTLFPVAYLSPEQAQSVGVPDVPEVEYYEVKPMKRMTLTQYSDYIKKYGRNEDIVP